MNLLTELTDTKKKLLLIGPHPDDVEFSAGRLLLLRKGVNSFVVIMTDGRKGQDAKDKNPVSEDEYAKIREDESRKALKEFGVAQENIVFFSIPDQGVISNPYIIDRLLLKIKRISPDYILVPPWEGAHPDHDATHLFVLIAAKNAEFDRKRIIEYGSYNNYGGKLRVQEFIPNTDSVEVALSPNHNEQKRWNAIMRIFRSQSSLHEKYIPMSKEERYRQLPDYDYSRLPYSTEQANIIRELLSPIYPIARRIIPEKQKMFYETWKDNINPSKVKEKLNEYIEHYNLKK